MCGGNSGKATGHGRIDGWLLCAGASRDPARGRFVQAVLASAPATAPAAVAVVADSTATVGAGTTNTATNVDRRAKIGTKRKRVLGLGSDSKMKKAGVKE